MLEIGSHKKPDCLLFFRFSKMPAVTPENLNNLQRVILKDF